jgi:ECF transporter S component (folate family)
MQNQKLSEFPTYNTCFSRAYWKSAVSELKNLKTIVFAAVMIAFRIVLKTASIPVADELSITFGYLLNALGSAVYGPIVGGFTGVICDILGYFVHPTGPFMPLFTVIEAMGSFVYGLVLYKAKFSVGRIFTAKLTVNVVVNMICTSLAMNHYYGKGIIYYMIPRIIKNTVMLPFETAVLILIFNAALVPLIRMKLISPDQTKIKLDWQTLIVRFIVTAICAALVLLFLYAFFQSGAYITMRDWMRGLVG